MRVLIIGGTRFIGPHVVRELNARGHEIALFHRGQTETEIPRGVKQIYGDRRSIRDYAAGLIEYSPHVVVDMIPISERELSVEGRPVIVLTTIFTRSDFMECRVPSPWRSPAVSVSSS